MTPTKIIPLPNLTGDSLAPEVGCGEMSVALPEPTQSVTFRAPFMLPGLDKPHRAGTFELRQTRRELDLSWQAYQIGLSLILVSGGITQALDVTRQDLEMALAADRDTT